MTVRALVESRWAEGVSRALGIPAERLGWLGRKAAAALADEGVVSSGNFVLSVLLGRWMAWEEYGLFALLYYGVTVSGLSLGRCSRYPG